MYRTGLAFEAAELAENGGGTIIKRRRFGNVKICDVKVGAADAERIGKAAGRYITIEGSPMEHAVAWLFQKALEQLAPRKGLILVAGLGNPDIAHDSLGARSVQLLSCGVGRRSLAAIETDVSANTGIDTALMVKAVAREMKASCVLAIDALACKDPLHIGSTVQITDTGIQPGSGVSSGTAALTREFVGIPVVAVGVPMVSQLSGLTSNERHKEYLISHANEERLTAQWSEVIAAAVNGLIV